MKIKYILYSLLLVVGLASCDKNDTPKPEPFKRTILVYLAADNDLNNYAYKNINRMLDGATKETLNNGNLIVFHDPSDNAPTLFEIKIDATGKAEKVILKTYEELNSADPEVMRSVINEVVLNSDYKADSYGLVLWSHGTGWLPKNYSSMLRSFGADGSSRMEIEQLDQAIPGNIFDFILFDACYMGSIEVAYELRNKADYIIGSPVEILADGFPYNRIIEPLFSETMDLPKVCDEFFNYYDTQTGLWKSAAVSIVETKYLEELKNVARLILKDNLEAVFGMSVVDIQKYDMLSSRRRTLYDFGDYMEHFALPEAYSAFNSALSKAIVYKKTTPNATYRYNGGSQEAITAFSGVSTYIPRENLPELNEWYMQNTAWAKAVYK